MKEIIIGGLKLYGRMIVISILSFFVVISIFAFGNAVFADEVGEKVVGTKNGKSETLYVHYYEDGEDTKLAEYEKQGYEIAKIKEKKMSSGKNVLTIVIAEVFALGLLVSFVYPTLWEKGNKELNLVRIGKKPEDKLRGLKMGVVASVPPILMFLVLAVGKFSFFKQISSTVYYLVNFVFFPVYKLVFEGASGDVIAANVKNGDLAFWQFGVIFLTLCILPITAHLGYYFGYKDVSFGEKFLYKKKRLGE